MKTAWTYAKIVIGALITLSAMGAMSRPFAGAPDSVAGRLGWLVAVCGILALGIRLIVYAWIDRKRRT